MVSKGKAFGRTPQRAKYFVVGSAFAGELRELLAALARGGFCKRKAPLRNCRYAQPSPTFQWTVGRQRERGTQFLQIKFSSTFFKRWRVSSGQRLLVERRSARNASIVRRLLEGEGNPCKQDFLRGPFCKRNRAQQTAVMYNPAKPPSGRFCCCRAQSPVYMRYTTSQKLQPPFVNSSSIPTYH